MDPQDQSEHEGVKNNPHLSDSRDRTRAVQPVANRLAASANWPTNNSVIYVIFTSSYYGDSSHLFNISVVMS